MENLKLRSGGKLMIKSRFDIKKGKSCQLQPHSSAFCDLAASIGVRDMLEQTMRHYSALTSRLYFHFLSCAEPSISQRATLPAPCSILTEGETFKINWFDQEFYFDVVKVSPGTAITLYGNLDLEVDLEVPLGDGKGRVRKTPRKRTSAASVAAASSAVTEGSSSGESELLRLGSAQLGLALLGSCILTRANFTCRPFSSRRAKGNTRASSSAQGIRAKASSSGFGLSTAEGSGEGDGLTFFLGDGKAGCGGGEAEAEHEQETGSDIVVRRRRFQAAFATSSGYPCAT